MAATRRPLLRGVLWALAAIALAAVFALYLRPDLVFSIANQVWACF